MSRFLKCLGSLLDMEWRNEYDSNGPDSYVCPYGCQVFYYYNSKPSDPKEHKEGCEYKYIIETMKKCIEEENPHDILKKIL